MCLRFDEQGDRVEAVFVDDKRRKLFLEMLTQVCRKKLLYFLKMGRPYRAWSFLWMNTQAFSLGFNMAGFQP